jgi:hypothetical protein
MQQHTYKSPFSHYPVGHPTLEDEQRNRTACPDKKEGCLPYRKDYKEMDDKKLNLAMNNTSAFALLEFFRQHMSPSNELIASYKAISFLTGWGSRTIERAVKALSDCSMISIEKSGTSNIYTINKDLCWEGQDIEKGFRVSRPNVIIIISEQSDEVQLKIIKSGFTEKVTVNKGKNK